MSFAYRPAVRAIRHYLHALSYSSCLSDILLGLQAPLLCTTTLVRLFGARQTTIGLHIIVTPCKSYAETRHAPVARFLVAHVYRLSQPIPHTARPELEILCNSFANQQRSLHLFVGHRRCGAQALPMHAPLRIAPRAAVIESDHIPPISVH